jgi:hypothetical protein
MRLLLVTGNFVPSSLILVTLMMEVPHSSKMSILIRATQCNIPEDGILHVTILSSCLDLPPTWPLSYFYDHNFICIFISHACYMTHLYHSHWFNPLATLGYKSTNYEVPHYVTQSPYCFPFHNSTAHVKSSSHF